MVTLEKNKSYKNVTTFCISHSTRLVCTAGRTLIVCKTRDQTLWKLL